VRWISEADISKSLSSMGDDSALGCELIADLPQIRPDFSRDAAFYALHSGQNKIAEIARDRQIAVI
jgi:hypothetical protein